MASLVRSLATSGAKRAKTSIVFLHFGQPRTEFYAKEFLLKAALNYYKVPSKLHGLVPSTFLVNDKVRNCVGDYGNQVSLENLVDGLSLNVEKALNGLLPEFGNINCQRVFLYDTKSFEADIESIIQSGADRVVLFPLFPHFSCSQSGLLLNAAATSIHATTIATILDVQPVESSRIRPQTDISFEVSAIHRWSSHPTIADMWAKRLEDERDSYDGIVFCAPAMRGNGQQEYQHSVWASCQRVADLLDDSVPWRLGFYNSWNEWCLPQQNSLISQVNRMVGKLPRQRKVAAVPITDILPSFDSNSVLPDIIAKNPKATLLKPDESNAVLTQGLAEIIKNHLLGRRNAQLQDYCDSCTRRECESTRLLLT